MGSSQEIFEQLSNLTRNLGSLKGENKGSSGEDYSSIFKKLTGSGLTAETGNPSEKSSGGDASGNKSNPDVNTESIISSLGGSEKLLNLVKSQLVDKDGNIDPSKAGGAIGALSLAASSVLGLKNKEKAKAKEEESSNKPDKPDDGMDFWRKISNQVDGKNPSVEDKNSKKNKKGESKLAKLTSSIKDKVSGITGDKSGGEGKFNLPDLNPLNLLKSKDGKSEEGGKSKDGKETSTENKGFFAKLGEKISGKFGKDSPKEETPKNSGEEGKGKSKLSQKIESAKEKLGSLIGKIKGEEDGEKSETSSDLKKESPTLKGVSSKKESPNKSEDSNTGSTTSSSSSEDKSTSASKSPSESSSTTQQSPVPAKTSADSSTKTSGEGGISPQDIQDLKSLLSAINATLSGPLTIKDNKPFRPKSSMLE